MLSPLSPNPGSRIQGGHTTGEGGDEREECQDHQSYPFHQKGRLSLQGKGKHPGPPLFPPSRSPIGFIQRFPPSERLPSLNSYGFLSPPINLWTHGSLVPYREVCKGSVTALEEIGSSPFEDGIAHCTRLALVG